MAQCSPAEPARSRSGLSLPAAGAIFALGLAGVLLNFWAAMQRQRFRERNGKGLVPDARGSGRTGEGSRLQGLPGSALKAQRTPGR